MNPDYLQDPSRPARIDIADYVDIHGNKDLEVEKKVVLKEYDEMDYAGMDEMMAGYLDTLLG